LYTDSKNEITYTNINPGVYTLKLKSANNDNLWNEKKLILIISPPYYQTTWFYTITALLLIGLLTFLLSFWKNQIKLKERRFFLNKENTQKTVMLKEIHHRVKNNLQVVNSLLRIQSSKVKGDSTLEQKDIIGLFKDSQKRVVSMALLHERMYQTKSLEKLNIEKHLEPIIYDLINTYKVNINIKLDLNLSPIELNLDTLVPLGLIINELISNALKYAFKGREKGAISVEIKPTELNNTYILIFGDDGIGKSFEENVNDGNLGAKLINSFVRQFKW